MTCMTCDFKEAAYVTLTTAVFYTAVFIAEFIDGASNNLIGILISLLVAVPMYGLSWFLFRQHRRQVAAQLARRLIS